MKSETGTRMVLIGLAILLLSFTGLKYMEYEHRRSEQVTWEQLMLGDAWYDYWLEVRIEMWETRIQY